MQHSTLTYEQAKHKYSFLINQRVIIIPGNQGCNTGVLLNILPNAVGLGAVTYLFQCDNGNIYRLVDWRIEPMTDAILDEVASKEITAIEEAEKVTKKRSAKKEAAPRAEKPAKEPKVTEKKQCLCGCGGLTASNFVPGHDARAKSMLRKAEGNKEETAKLPAALVAFARSNEKWSAWFPNL